MGTVFAKVVGYMGHLSSGLLRGHFGRIPFTTTIPPVGTNPPHHCATLAHAAVAGSSQSFATVAGSSLGFAPVAESTMTWETCESE